MPSVQISMGLIMSFTFLNFLIDFLMQIMNMRCRCECSCKLGYSKMLYHRDKIYRLSRSVTMHNLKWTMPIDIFPELLYVNLQWVKSDPNSLNFQPIIVKDFLDSY